MASSRRSSHVLRWVRVVLGVAGLVAVVLIVRHVGARVVWATLRPAIGFLPALCALELCRMACEAAASYLAFGPVASRIPRLALLRANVVGPALSNLAPAPRVVNETIKVTLLGPYAGVEAATCVGFVNQAATLMAIALFSIPCSVAMFVLSGASIWFWAVVVHGVVLGASGLGLRAATSARGPVAWVARRFPRLEPRATLFREHASSVKLWATGPTVALFVNRCFQAAEYAVAARAVGIDATAMRALASEGVNLVAAAVGVLVPGGLGTTDGAFTLAAELLSTTTARATSLALLVRCMQIIWLLVGSLVLLSKGPRVSAAADDRHGIVPRKGS
jgi:lysylphosphatidylglycerol synthase-like protein